MAKQEAKLMPAPTPEECGADINTDFQFRLEKLRRAMALGKDFLPTINAYARFCVGRDYTIPAKEEPRVWLTEMIGKRKLQALKHRQRIEASSRGGKISGENRRKKSERTRVKAPSKSTSSPLEGSESALITCYISDPKSQPMCAIQGHTQDEIIKIGTEISKGAIPESFLKHYHAINESGGWKDSNGNPILNIGQSIAKWWDCEKDKARFMETPQPQQSVPEWNDHDRALCADKKCGYFTEGKCSLGMTPPRTRDIGPQDCEYYKVADGKEAK